MGLAHSSKIVTDGLVFYYDMNNTQKSFKGAPTTNLVTYPYANWSGSAFNLGYNKQDLGATYTYVTGVDNPIDSPGVLQYYTGTGGYQYFSVPISVPSSGTYNFSYYARIVKGANNSAFNNSQIWRNVGVGDITPTGDWNPTMTNEWKRFSCYGAVATQLQFFPVHSGVLSANVTLQYCGFQLESGSINSTFVSGSRSNTQSIIDLTGQNIVTANSLTYAIDNTFSFNGSSDLIIIPNNTALDTNNPTIEVWVKPSTLNQNGFWFEKGNVNSQYCLFQENTQICFRTKPSGTYDSLYGASSVLSTTNYTHVVAVKTNSEKIIYINGVKTYSKSYTDIITTTTDGMSIGAYINSSGGIAYYYNGSIASVKIYNRALSESEILQNFNAHRGRYGI